MTIPPFPSQDLAKLVLGYLAEEQLMTAYDEFLQASPYLDVLRNEYDRIFMTSLKNILAEYRAVKIYVETCKPFLLRKKLFQCSNLLEVVKFLVNHIDVNRLHPQDSSIERLSNNKHTLYSKSNVCEICYSLSLDSCVCKAKTGKTVSNTRSSSQIDAKIAENSIETTSLADLPGNFTKKRNSTKALTAEITNSECSPAEGLMNTTLRGHNVLSSTSNKPLLPNTQNNVSLTFNTKDVSLVKSDESKQKIDEFNNILNLVCSDNKSINPPRKNNYDTENSSNRLSNMGVCQELNNTAGNSDKEKPIVPDSSTSEIFNAQTITSKENGTNLNPITNIKGPPIAQFLLKAGTISNPYFQKNKDFNNILKSDSSVKIKEKCDDSKVTILSDVKVDDAFKNSRNKMPVTSSPVVQMQTIVINGTPAYKYKQRTATNFTEDEIMAMPTIILVPTSGSSQNSSTTYSQSNMSPSTNTITTNLNSTPRLLGPLVIDVPSDNQTSLPSSNDLPELISEDCNKVVSADLVKTVDVTAHCSLPKDTNNSVLNKTNTPNALPPTRKSSSTPRRNSHVRVLDFATPRRILHETISELAPTQSSSETVDIGTEIPPDTPDMPVHKCIVTSNNNYDKTDSIIEAKSTKTTKKSKLNKSNWDAELRALALGTINEETELTPKTKHKKKKKKVTLITENVHDNLEMNNIKSSDKKDDKSRKSKKSKKHKKVIEIVEEPIKEEVKIPEIINIVAECDVYACELESTENQTNAHNSDEHVDTPESERLSLQNVIGAKLNISDLLETPYKQALYDIQMETPKFLGPDLPDDPISDVKIMSIPTPRFLNTPKAIQATPSYTSRLTDYSSGGSYYKPDDHDYIPSSEVLHCTVTVEKMTKSESEEIMPIESKGKENSDKPSRPQRRCARNVSYKGSVICKTNENEMLEVASVSSETSNKSTKSKKSNKTVDSKARLNLKDKSDSKKKIKAYKSPQKPKNFMKIKPRRPTPVKESASKMSKVKSRNKNADLPGSHIKSLSKKGTTIKDKSPNIRPLVTTVQTKSRRKSSTPRKLNCTTPSPSVNSSDLSKSIENVEQIADSYHEQQSDSQKQPPTCSNNRSQDTNFKEEQPTSSSLPEEDDITKIKEYIETSAQSKNLNDDNNEGSLHIDLIKRGFDVETAKIIERDLLDTTPIQDTAVQSTSNEDINVKNLEVSIVVSDRIESDSSVANNLQIVQDEEDCIEEFELSVHECNETTDNFISCQFDESTFTPNNTISTLKDKFSIELCIDDGVTVRLRAVPFRNLFDIEPEDMSIRNSYKETEDAVKSISNIDKLYTPMKDHREEYYKIFDSTLTSIDTPIKSDLTVQSNCETEFTEIVLEVESIDPKEKLETKKRKRLQSSNLEDSLNKKSKPDTQYLLNSANIQNIDIESVLSKLHGP